jgi:hypothetical protein
MPHEKLLGEILVEHGIISAKTRDRVLNRAKLFGRRFGSVLEDLELITGEEIVGLVFTFEVIEIRVGGGEIAVVQIKGRDMG